MVTEIKYSATNTYVIHGKKGNLLFDTGWAGTFPAFCKALGENNISLQSIKYLLISHFHPDHMGIAGEIAAKGCMIAAADVQSGYIHSSDHIFEKENNKDFIPVVDAGIRTFPIGKSRGFLKELGISGEIFHTPGHSDDSISLWLDKEKILLVGDLPPLYELEMHQGTQIAESWEKLLKLKPKKIYYGHARPYEPQKGVSPDTKISESDTYSLVKKITKLIDKGRSEDEICQKTGADKIFIRDVTRMYLTHQNISVQGILDRIEIKGK